MSAHPESDLQKTRSRETGAAAPTTPALPEAQVCQSVQKNAGTRFLAPPVQERAIADQDNFLHLLSLERKRSERTGSPLLLMLLRDSDIFQSRVGDKVVREFQRHVFPMIREIDVVGWYQRGATLGIIFTELAEANQFIAAAILRRITDAITRTIGHKCAETIAITYHMFSDNPGGGNGDAGDGMHFYPDVRHSENRRRWARLMKRILDVFGSLLALMVLSPIFLVIALLVKLSSPGPVFYRQQRVGHYGKCFTCLKFRSMYVDNDPHIHKEYVKRWIAGKATRHPSKGNGDAVYKLTKDDRVTRVGAFLRQTSLDEVPQFINVLKGEMSLVGPRPPLAYEVETYGLWHRRRVLEAKPGITGLWQVNGRNRIAFDDMVRLDLTYARTWSFWLDLKILLRTPLAVIEGAH